mmetsp:Transcript_4872/g.10298  ORF Transcript_4872/g.10298 Transcript_4872/m.10298 type:complete len:769 (-) Transcript_4872:228-2534(-)
MTTDSNRRSFFGSKGRQSASKMSKSSMHSSRASTKSFRQSSKLGQSKRNYSTAESQSAQVVVRDENGVDVTPKSLLSVRPTVLRNQPLPFSLNKSGTGSPTSEVSYDRMSSAGFSRSGWTSDGTTTPSMDGDDVSEVDENEMKGADKAAAEKQKKKEEVITIITYDTDEPKVESEEDLEKHVAIMIEETETMFLLDIPSVCVAAETEEHEQVTKENEEYAEKKKASASADRSSERGVQTAKNPQKIKLVQSAPPRTLDVGCNASSSDIFDTYDRLDRGEELEGTKGAFKQVLEENVKKIVNVMEAQNTKQEEGKNEGEQQQTTTVDKVGGPKTDVNEMENLSWSLKVVERIVNQNVYHEKHLMYRGTSADDTENTAMKAALSSDITHARMEFLWSFTCPLSKGRTVTSVAYNPINSDLIAVGYGKLNFSDDKSDGLILFWSLKNPEYPERVIKTKHGVSALAFSKEHANILAVGLYDGNLCIYDVRKESDTPLLQSVFSSFKHSDAIWNIKWIDKGSDMPDALVTISTDGHIVQWSMKKGLDHKSLMKLKRVTASAGSGSASSKSDAFISRSASGMCIDFFPPDSNFYLAGTEEGTVHKCSCSYSEQYLETYTGHQGPIYSVNWSPFLPSAFITASADWTAKLWDQDKNTPAMSFATSSGDAVADIAWSPRESTVFCYVTRNGRVDLWDLSESTLDPVAHREVTNKKLTRVAFSPSSPVIAAGDDDGGVDLYRIKGLKEGPRAMEDQAEKLRKVFEEVRNYNQTTNSN